MTHRHCILLVKRDPGRRRSVHFALMAIGYRVHSHSYARTVLVDPPADAACQICGYELSDSDGISLLSALRKLGWDKPAALIAPASSPDVAERAVAAGFKVVLERPYTREQLKVAVNSLLPA
jgi:two-component system response regulator FixJ